MNGNFYFLSHGPILPGKHPTTSHLRALSLQNPQILIIAHSIHLSNFYPASGFCFYEWFVWLIPNHSILFNSSLVCLLLICIWDWNRGTGSGYCICIGWIYEEIAKDFDITVMMGSHSCYFQCSFYHPNHSITNEIAKFYHVQTSRNSLYRNPKYFYVLKHHFDSVIVGVNLEEAVKTEVKEENPRRFRWIEVGRNITEEQKEVIAKLPFQMTKRNKALMRQIICFSPEKGEISDLLRAWVKIMNPRRADWLKVLKELQKMNHPLFHQVFHFF